MSATSNKIALFIDGANLHVATKTLGFDIDYRRLLKEFESYGTLLRAFYYTAVVDDHEVSSIRPLIDWLSYNGYTVVTKPTKEFVDAGGRRKVKGNMDIELAVDAMELAAQIDQMVLVSGDGDFRCLVEAMQRRGVRVTVISTASTQPALVADELRRQADVFIDLVELRSKISRDSPERPREPRHHAPQFLQRTTTKASRALDDFDDWAGPVGSIPGAVVIFEEDTPIKLITQVKPSVLVKGGDYTHDQVVGHEIVEAQGGKVMLVDVLPGFSTTSLVNRARGGVAWPR